MPSHPIVRICPQELANLEVNWQPHHGINCWWDGNGTEDVDSPNGSTAPGDVRDLDECKTSCLLEPRCDAVLVVARGDFKCFRKRNIHLGSCSPDMRFELYYKNIVYPPSPPAPPLPPPHGYCASAGVESTEATGVGAGQGIRRRLDEQDVLAMPTWWKRWGEEPFAAAAALVDAMNPSERARFVQGVGWTGWNLDNGYYVGSILGVPRQVSLSPICPICHPHFPHLSHPVSPHISPQAFARFDDQAGRGVNPHAGQRPGFSHHGWRDKSCSGHRMALAPRCGRHVGRAAH